MTDLSKDANIRVLGTLVTEKFTLDTSAAQHPYRGSPRIIDQSEDTLNVVLC
jgi:ribosomal protein L31